MSYRAHSQIKKNYDENNTVRRTARTVIKLIINSIKTRCSYNTLQVGETI